MSKRTLGPERPGWAALARPHGPWTPEQGLGVAAGALVLLAIASSCVDRQDFQASPTDARDASVVSSPARDATGATPGGRSGSPGSATSHATPAAVNRQVPSRGAGTTRVLAVPGSDSDGEGRTVRYTVEVEDGAGVDETEFAHVVRDVLTDKRGWQIHDQVHFVNVSPERFTAGEKPEVRITLASPDTVDELCAPMDTEGQVSCSNGDRVALNSIRWTQGVQYYPDDLLRYRIYLVNHEVGHAIGHDHEACPGPGRPAPVMLQQTLGLQGCTGYPWPVPGQQP